MRKMKKEVRIWCNPVLLTVGLILTAVNLGFCCWIVFFTGAGQYYTEADEIGSKWIFGILGAGFLAGMIASLPRWAARVCLTEDGIRWGAPFRKAKQAPWSKFPNVYGGRYWNGVYYKYLVLTSRCLTSEEQEHINQVPMAEDLIKIRYREGTFRRIREVMPPEYLNKHRAELDRFGK